MLSTTLIFATLLLSVRATDECGGSCTSTQVCADGTCINTSDLVKCGSWTSAYYCHKGYECCGYQGCMPAGNVCCQPLSHCPTGHTCCGLFFCCEAGTFCDDENGRCVLDKYSTRKPSTTRSVETTTSSKTARTLYPTTKARTSFPTEPRTRYPTIKSTDWFSDYTTRTRYPTIKSTDWFSDYTRTRYSTDKTTRWFNDYTTKSSFRTSYTSNSTFRWWYGLIACVAVLIVGIIIIAVICNRRNSGVKASSQSGNGGVVLGAPVQTYGQTPGNNMPVTAPNTGVTVPGQSGSDGTVRSASANTCGQSPGNNRPRMAPNTGVTAQTNGHPQKRSIAVFLVRKKGVQAQTNNKPPNESTAFVITKNGV